MNLERSHPKPAAANLSEPALAAASGQPGNPVAQPGHEGVLLSGFPDFTERAVLDVAKGVPQPEAVWMNFPLAVDICNAEA